MKLGRILLSVGLGAFAAAAMASGLDRISEGDAGVERVVPWPFRAQADRSAAAVDLARKHGRGALAHSADAVAHDPVDPDATALLGSSRLLLGDDNGSAAAFRVAASFGWRNEATQLYWYQAALQAGDFRVAADRVDAILRTHPAFPERDALLEPLERDPKARSFLLEHLAAQPAWLEEYLGIAANAPEDLVHRRTGILEALGGTGRPLGCKRVFFITQALMARGERPQAVQVWNANCRAAPVTSGITDSGFDLVDSENPSPFGWQLYRTGDVSINVAAAGGTGKELVIQNRAASTQLALQQPVTIPEGTYRIRAAVRNEIAGPTDQLLVSVGCDKPPFPSLTNGNLSGAGQVITVPRCDRLLLGVWIRPGEAGVKLDSLQLQKLD